jgi:hypothetical protein
MLRDHFENFELTDGILKQHPLEADAINYLFDGLQHLYESVKEHERDENRPLNERMAEAQKSGKVLRLPGHVPTVIVCAFHWYATTACNWVNMIGWICKCHYPSAKEPKKYVMNVIPSVKRWRDKVSAHFCVHSPRRDDTPADIFASLIPPTTILGGKLVASAYTIKNDGRGESQLPPWSLTEIHERLCTRYGMPLGQME